MKHKSTLEIHLHRFQQLKEDLGQRKEDVLERLDHLQQLYKDSQTRIATKENRDPNNDTDQPNRNRDGVSSDHDDVNVSQMYEQARHRLRELVTFLEARTSEMLNIKAVFRSEYPLGPDLEGLDLAIRNTARDEEFSRKRDEAVCRMTERLEALRQNVSDRLDEEYGRTELDDLMSRLNKAAGRRSRPQTKRNCSSSGSSLTALRLNRSSSLSKERLLSKAKQIRAAKEAHSNDPTGVPLWGRSMSAKRRVENGDGSKTSAASVGSQDKDGGKLPSPKIENQTGDSSPKEPRAESIQVQEVTSSVQEGGKAPTHNSFGESSIESSILTSSTVSAVMGDSSLLTSAVSSDPSDVKQGLGSDSSLDSVAPCAAEAAFEEEHGAGREFAGKRRGIPLARPLGGSRYIQVGLPESPSTCQGTQGLPKTSSKFCRPSYSTYLRGVRHSQGHPLSGLASSRRSVYGRPQSPRFGHRFPWHSGSRECLQPPGKHSEPPRATHRQDRARSSRCRMADLQDGLLRLEAMCPGVSGQEGAAWLGGQGSMEEASGGRRNGVSSAEGWTPSGSPTPDDEREGRSDDDRRDEMDGCPAKPTTVDKSLVLIQLVMSEHLQKHRGPGLMDHRTPCDRFTFPREKSLEELADFIQKRVKNKVKGRIKLWLFEEDEEGMFLPRKVLRGRIAKRSVGSLNAGTVTLFLQVLEPHERLYTLDQGRIKFMFVKTPQGSHGEIGVKGHHHVDIGKATRAVIHILKKKFMPHSSNRIKLCFETGEKFVSCISHRVDSTLEEDAGRRTRDGDILVLLEELKKQGQYPIPGQNSQLLPPAWLPVYPQGGASSNGTVDSQCGSCGESDMTSDNSPVSTSPPDSPPTGPERMEGGYPVDQDGGHPDPAYHLDHHEEAMDEDGAACHQDHSGGLLDQGQHLDHNGTPPDPVCRLDLNGEAMEESEGVAAAVAQPRPEAMPTNGTNSVVNFIIPFDSATSTSDDSLTSTVSDTHNDRDGKVKGQGSGQGRAGHRRQVLQWNLTNNYMSRFSHLKEHDVQSSSQAAGDSGPAERGDLPEDVDVCGSAPEVEYDSVELSSGRIQLTSVEYESLVVSSLGEEGLSQDTSSSALATDRAAVRTTKVTQVRSSLQVTTDSPLLAAGDDPDVADLSRQLECTSVSVTSTEMTGSQNQVLVATINISENQKVPGGGRADGSEATPHKAGPLNPVAPVFTPRTRFRLQQLGKRVAYRGLTEKSKGGSRGKTGEERLHHGRQDCHSGTASPKTPHSGNSVLASDEELSVYYTPAPAFVYPDARPRLQSTAIPLADINYSDSQSQLIPDQISAITNRSSSFMAVRLSRPPSTGMEQISDIPNISSSFMEIPSRHQLHNSSLPGHSTSISQQNNSSSDHHDPSFVAPTSPELPRPNIETSHLQASSSAVLPCPMKPSHRLSALKKARTSTWSNKRNGIPHSPPTPPQSPYTAPWSVADGKETRQPCPTTKSQASTVKQEDPAIMDIGQRVLGIAQKSSLNANAMEFVPKERTAPPPSRGLAAHTGLVGAGEGAVSHQDPAAHPVQLNGPPLASKLFRCTTVDQQAADRAVFPVNRASSINFKAPAHPPAPVHRLTSSTLYSALKQQSGALTTFDPKPPILVSLTNGSRDALPPKPRPDTSRHVTFADPPIMSGKMGSRGKEPTHGLSALPGAYTQLPTAHLKPPVHPNHVQPGRPRLGKAAAQGRKKIGSGRFDDGPKRLSVEFRKSTQSRPTPAYRTPAQDPTFNPALSNLRNHPSYAKTYSYYSVPAHSGYTVGRGVPVYLGPRSVQKRAAPLPRRDEMGGYNGQYLPPPSHYRMDHFPNDFQTLGYLPSGHRQAVLSQRHPGGHFVPEQRGYAQGQSFQPEPRPYNAHKPPRSFPPSQTAGYARERGLPKGGHSKGGSGPPAMDFRFRRAIRAQATSNSSSELSDSSLQHGPRQGPVRFRRGTPPVHESETETSLGSVTFNSEGSNVSDSAGEKPAPVLAAGAAASPADTGSGGESSEKMSSSSQSSTSSRQSMRLRKGYIQLGLEDIARPSMSRGD